MFKTLIGAAAIAVIAFVAYFFWMEWQAYDARVRFENAAAAELKQKEQAAADTRAAAEARLRLQELEACKAIETDLRTVLSGKSLGHRFSQTDAKVFLRKCIANGHLQDDDLADII